MRNAFACAVALVLSLLLPATARAQSLGSVGGFGGLSITSSRSTTPDLGGTLAFNLTPHIQAIGEVGRVGNVLPPVADSLFSAFDTGIHASALYAEGGIRFNVAPHSRVRPYGEATAGVARLDVNSSRLGTIGGGLTSAAIAFLGRTGPMAGVGAGVEMSAGPMVFDVGYRYKQLFPPDPLATVLGLGQSLGSQQVRVGVGVRF